LHEPEDVVDEEQDVLVLHVAEVLGHGQGREPDAEAHARRLVHLAEDQGRLVDDAGLLHLDPEVRALASALPHPREHRHAAVLGGDTVDHLEDDDRLADARAAEHADLAAADVGLEQVDDLDAGLEHLPARLELAERGRLPVDVPVILDPGELVGGHVERLAQHVEDVPEHAVADRHLEAVAQVAHLRAAAQAVGRLHADGANPVVAELLRDFGDDRDRLPLELDLHIDGGVDLGEGVGRELHIDDRAGDGDDAPVLQLGAGALLGGHGHQEYSSVRCGISVVTAPRGRAGPRRTALRRPPHRVGGEPRRRRRSR
jgi:peptide chain release factor 1